MLIYTVNCETLNKQIKSARRNCDAAVLPGVEMSWSIALTSCIPSSSRLPWQPIGRWSSHPLEP